MPQPPLIPREVLFGNPERMSVRLSPDGDSIAYIAPLDGVLNVWVRSREGGDDRPVTRDTHRGIRHYFWAYDGEHICTVQDRDGDENWHVYAVSLKTGAVRDLTPFEGVHAQPLAAEPEHPNEILIGLNKENPQLHDVYRVRIDTGEMELTVPNPGDMLGYDADWHLNIRAGTAQAADGGTDLRRYHPETGEWETLIHAPFGEEVYAFGVTPDMGGLYIASSLDTNTSRVLKLDFATGEQTPLAGREDVDFDGDRIVHPTRRHLQAVSFTKARQEWTFLDPDFEQRVRAAARIHAGEMDVVSRDLSDRWWILAFSSDVDPVKYFLWDCQSGAGSYLFSQNSALEEAHLAPMRPVEITARDGLRMVCYLTLPEGAGPKNLPLVLNVHGGGRMHDDLIDAVNRMVDDGIADPEKVAIFGWSYGGYAALVGMTFTPDVFAAGVAGVGISNLVSWYHSIPPYWEPMREQINLRVGNADTEEQFMLSRSPLFRVDQIRRPLMIAQGANDPRVPRAEADQMVEALRSRGISVEYLLFEDEGHGFARPENRLSFYAAAEGFLAGVLGGRVEA